MAETVESERWAHIRGVTVTTIASISGIIAGLLSSTFAAGPDDLVGVAIMAIAIFVQFPIYRVAGIAVENFGIKDYLYIAFMTFSFWFVTWGILMTTEASLPL